MAGINPAVRQGSPEGARFSGIAWLPIPGTWSMLVMGRRVRGGRRAVLARGAA
jgi:hypothetical protein